MKALTKQPARKLPESATRRVALIAILLLVVLIVRLFYYTGPVFANTQDEIIYYSQIVNTAVFHSGYNFSSYRNVDFSNLTNVNFNPDKAFQFYVGLMYPEIMLAHAFGYSVNLPIYYVMLTSVIEALFIFLIVERISSIRAAAISCILFAFLPLNVLFSTQLEPQVPLAMASSVAVYFFIVALDAKTLRKISSVSLVSGLFIGFGFVTNPFGSATLVFIALFLAILSAKILISRSGGKEDLRKNIIIFALIIGGFAAAYSVPGLLYQAESGNFFLYPEVYHSITLYQFETQASPYLNITRNLSIVEITGSPYFYLPILMDQPSYYYDPYLRYWGISFYVLVGMLLFLPKSKHSWAYFFGLMFIVYLAIMSLAPTAIITRNSATYVLLDSKLPYVAEALTLPSVVMVALGMDALIRSRKKLFVTVAILILLAVVCTDLIDLQHDSQYYRASIATVKDLAAFAASHPNSTIYAQWIFAEEANLYSGYKYHINSTSCASEGSLELNNSYIALGGTTNFDMSPPIMYNFTTCTLANFSEYSRAYNVTDPYARFGNDSVPQFEIINLSNRK